MARKQTMTLTQQRRIHKLRSEGRKWADIAVDMGKSVDSVRWAFRQNNIKMRARGLSCDQYFRVLIGESADPELAQPPPYDDIEDEADGDKWVINQKYVYNSDTDVYITFIPGFPPLAIPGDVHRGMLTAYSNWDGLPATINEICRDFDMPRAWFSKYKQAYGWTHDMEPFSAEEVEERDPDELADEALQMRRRALYQKFEKKKWLEIKKAAEKWNDFEYSTLSPLIAAIKGSAPQYEVQKLELDGIQEDGARIAAVVSILCDLHFGKYSWSEESGAGYSREIARNRVLDAAKKAIRMIGRVDTVILPIGSDDVHIDNQSGSTTRGTPQDTDGTATQIVIEYSELMIEVVDMFRHVADKVMVPVVHGNHNYHTAVMQGVVVDAWFRQCDDVEVMSKAQPRSYIQYGSNLIGLAHGDGEKPASLPGLMAKEQPRIWADTTHRTWITNHLHHEKLANLMGVRIYTTPALSGPDRWHFKKGYVGDAEAAVYLFNYDEGVAGTILITPNC